MRDSTLFKMTIGVLFIPIIIAAGCQERYRYPCQDPANWEKAECKKPLCEVHRQCPELIFKEDSIAVGINPAEVTVPPPKTCEKGCK
jgi:hypothetical protein